MGASRPPAERSRDLPKVRKPTSDEIAASKNSTIPDVIAPNLALVFVGINPGLYSAAVGHHFARPGNRFWPALHKSGFTDRLLSPLEDVSLLDDRCGITNVVRRATARADELSDAELEQGARRLKRKVTRYRIACVAFLGITAYRTAFRRPNAVIGRQAENLGPAHVWVLPNPSGLNAHYQLPDFIRLFRKLHRAVLT